MKIALIFGLVIVAGIVWMLVRPPKLARIEGPLSSWSIPDSWSIGTADVDGKPVITRFNHALRPAVGHPLLRKQLGIAVPLTQPTQNGLPAADENKQLYDIEDEIRTRFSKGNESLFAGIITTGNMREFVLYTSDEVAAVAKAQQLAKDVTHHEIQFVVNDDPEWNIFKQFAGLR